MQDPYQVLGIQPSASDDEVKRAYRDLVKQYHPDHYQNNPLSDLAEEKMKAINEAYDTIVRQRASGAGARGYAGQGSGTDERLREARRCIDNRQLLQAQQILSNYPDHNAEWHFLYGSVSYLQGRVDDAHRHFEMAQHLEPHNIEYHQAVNHIRQQTHQGFHQYQSTGGLSAMDCCNMFLCWQCCCGGCN